MLRWPLIKCQHMPWPALLQRTDDSTEVTASRAQQVFWEGPSSLEQFGPGALHLLRVALTLLALKPTGDSLVSSMEDDLSHRQWAQEKPR